MADTDTYALGNNLLIGSLDGIISEGACLEGEVLVLLVL